VEPVEEVKKSKKAVEPVEEVKKSKKTVQPEVVESKTKKSKDEPRKLSLKKYNDNMYIHDETQFIFNKEDKMVVGKLAGSKIVDLTLEDIELCNKWKFKYVEPKKIINAQTKPGGESDDEDNSELEDSDISSSESEEDDEDQSESE